MRASRRAWGNGAPTDAPGRRAPAAFPDAPAGRPDAPTRPIDAFVPPIDAPPGMTTITLDQNMSDMLVGDTSVACQYTEPNIGTRASKYYRVFVLSDFNITTAFHVSSVAFQVEDCESGGANCTSLNVDVGTYTPAPGPSLTGTFSQLATATATVPLVVEDENGNTPGGTVTTPITATIPAIQICISRSTRRTVRIPISSTSARTPQVRKA